jgi:hypothetical protein
VSTYVAAHISMMIVEMKHNTILEMLVLMFDLFYILVVAVMVL